MTQRGIPKPPPTHQDGPSLEPGRCTAPGCKLPGTMTTATTGGTEWYCRLHFGASYGEMAEITLRANNRSTLFRMALRWSNASPNEPVPAEVVAILRQAGRESLLSAKPAVEGRPMTMRTLARHLLAQLDAECRVGDSTPAQPEPATETKDTWARASDMVGEVW